MKYALLIYAEEVPPEQVDPEETQRVMDAYWKFSTEVAERGVDRGAEALHPTSMTTTVRVRNGEVLTTDGPFVETKEVLGGFYLVDVADLDEALELAAKIPGAAHGAVEVRPVVVFDAPDAAD